MLTEEDKRWIEQQLEAQRVHVAEKLEQVETTFVTEFHEWASPFEARQRSHSAGLRAIDAEIENLQDRVKRLEQGGRT